MSSLTTSTLWTTPCTSWVILDWLLQAAQAIVTELKKVMQGNAGMPEAFFVVQCLVMMSQNTEMLLTCNATCRYIPAEILKGDVSDLQKADIFMLGITLYELATNLELPTGKHQQITTSKCSHSAQ